MSEQSLNSAVTMRSGENSASLGRIDQYEILRELGGGGFGMVYLAKDTVSGVEVAVKGLPPLVKNNKEELENIRQNFALVSRLHHPNIAAALVLHPANKVSYSDKATSEKLRVFAGDTLMVMEYAPGVTLSQWRRQFPDKRVPMDKAIAITRQIAEALDYAHERKIIHRDIKPSNIMIETSAEGVLTARVLDFGLAAEIRSSMGRVSREIHDTSGTRPYMAPEQWSGDRQGPATDQYALAVLFYELIVGEVPFASVFDCGDPIVMLSTITTRPAKVPDGLPKNVQLALKRGLGKERESRFATCADFVAALEGRKVAKPGGTRSRAPALAVVAAALALAIVGGWLLGRGGTGKSVMAETDRAKEVVGMTEYNDSKPGDTKTITLPGGATMEMVWCPATTSSDWKRLSGGNDYFMMGSPSTEDPRDSDETQHRVTLTQGFWMGKYEVTQCQWESVMGSNPSNFKGANRPVEKVSWDDCQEFIRKINAAGQATVSLPTEAQWEYACRAGTTTPFNFGSVLNGDKANCDGNYPYGTSVKGRYRGKTADVGSYAPNAWGLYDMHGNVWEWCSDWKGDYTSDATDPTGPASGANRVLRGGSWYDLALNCRSASRGRLGPGDRDNYLGLRLVCSAGPRR